MAILMPNILFFNPQNAIISHLCGPPRQHHLPVPNPELRLEIGRKTNDPNQSRAYPDPEKEERGKCNKLNEEKDRYEGEQNPTVLVPVGSL